MIDRRPNSSWTPTYPTRYLLNSEVPTERAKIYVTVCFVFGIPYHVFLNT
jgi:hypothetical protein